MFYDASIAPLCGCASSPSLSRFNRLPAKVATSPQRLLAFHKRLKVRARQAPAAVFVQGRKARVDRVQDVAVSQFAPYVLPQGIHKGWAWMRVGQE